MRYTQSYLLISLLSEGELILTAQVACILLIRLGVGFVTGCRSLKEVSNNR